MSRIGRALGWLGARRPALDDLLFWAAAGCIWCGLFLLWGTGVATLVVGLIFLAQSVLLALAQRSAGPARREG